VNTPHPLRPLLAPRSIAVVGASDTPGKVGTSIFRNLIEYRYTGALYAVNQKSNTVAGQTAFHSLENLPEPIELAVLCTPAPSIPTLIEQCGAMRIPAALVITAGFCEIGPLGSKLQEQLDESRAKYPWLKILGPNCLGLIHPASRMSASFARGMPQTGSLAFVSQSGALCTAFLDWSLREGIGFSHFVSLGNQLDVGFSDLLDYLADDPNTNSAILYIESITKPKEFIKAARRFTSRKPLIAYKAGRFAASAQAAASHTGSLAGVDEVYHAVMQRCGIVRVYDMESMVQCAELLSEQTSNSNPLAIGERIAIVTNAGGPGVMASDMLIEQGGALTKLTSSTISALNDCLPANWSKANPVDVIGDSTPERFARALQIVLTDPNVDTVIAILSPQAMTNPTETAQLVSQISIPSGKRILAAWMGGVSMQAGIEKLQASGIRNFDTPEQAVRGLMRLIEYKKLNLRISDLERFDSISESTSRLAHTHPAIPTAILSVNQLGSDSPTPSKGTPDLKHFVTELDSKQLLTRYGIPTPSIQFATNSKEAVELADAIGYPVVLKIHSKQITHKTDVGGVLLGLQSPQEVQNGFDKILSNVHKARPDLTIEGITVQPMVQINNAVELIIGSKKDPVFGPVLLVGLGGVTAELFQDRALELPPITPARFLSMLKSLRCWPLLDGYRGRPKANIEALTDIMAKYSTLILEQDWIEESDLNPVLVNEHQAVVLDARFVGIPDQ